MVNIQLLKDKIRESGMTTVSVCKKSGILRQTLYNRYDNPNFTIDEINGLKQALNLKWTDVKHIFFD